MSVDNSWVTFYQRNKRAILATVAAGTAAAGAYYYYKQLQNAQDNLKDNKASSTASGESSSKKKKKKKKSKSAKELSPATTDGKPIYPVRDNGEPNLDNKDQFTEEEKEKYSIALKDKGNSLFKADKFEEAIKYYNWAIELKENPIFYSNLSACYVSLNKLEEIIKYCNKALELKPDYSKVLLRRANANEKLENYADAMFDLSVLSLNGDYNGASIEPILERNLNKQAMSVLKDKLKNSKDDQLPSDTSLSAFFGIFKPELSFENYDETNDADKELLNGLTHLFKRQSESYLIADKSFMNALELYIKQLEETPDDTDLKVKASIAYEYAGIFNFLKNDLSGATENIDKSIKLNPRINSYIYRALIIADKGESQDYLDYFDKALKLDDKSCAVYYHRAQLNFVTQDFAKAAVDFEKAKECDPTNIFPYIQLACLTYRENKFDDCETLFSEAKRKFPTLPEVPNFYAEVLTDKGDFDNAMKNYETARRLEEASKDGIHVGVAPLIGKATLLAREPTLENLAAADKLLEEANRIDPRSEQAKIGLAQLKLQKEEIDESIRLFEESADLARTMEEKLQATTFAEAAKVQKMIRADPIISKKIEETLAAYRAQNSF
ncbi:hypothetical protein TBLA_0C05530 [Henningerozyma blattae CBS 6284]|uniref:TOM70 n=1 Tax=Henningerozyma blattae (strain ATCC 34711 / CBS 6284 / DSM 70876 / NBRC 10599 / NRRL Y-10934 / UCD 77-7) TaxID=1071380 RepID=I2H1U9_HENB6|nr:hypothetical protein TBLA_0C05530 [Tetrapisispora blattae CBS 6284]CCH60351.1 hypothetical protein TBLA_0C05530 [Tetrapisispora blattae CBS 6284]